MLSKAITMTGCILLLLLPSPVLADDDIDYEEFDGRNVTEINVVGHSVTKDYIIQREIELVVGYPFDGELVEGDIQRLTNLGIFSSIRVSVAENDNGVAVEYRVRELPWIVPYLKFKFTEENGWSAGPTLSSVNLLGRDISLSGFALFGGVTTFSMTYIQPWIAGPHLSLSIIAAHIVRNNEFELFEETSDEVTVEVGRYLGEHGRARGILGYWAVESDKDSITISPSNRDDYFRVGAAVGYDTRDDWQAPTRGWESELKALGSLGESEFITVDLDIRRFQPTRPGQNLAVGGLFSYQTGEVDVDVPRYMRYYMGGANSIRGHVVPDLGRQLNGKNQLITTFEYNFTLLAMREYEISKWAVNGGAQLSLFADFGTAWSDHDEFTGRRMKAGYGAGIRFLVPAVNVVRIDVGFNKDGEAQFHFGLWSKFDGQRLRLR